MAGRQRFLSPAHFEHIPRKSMAKPAKDSEGRRLLPPGVYEKVKSPSRDKEISELKESLDLTPKPKQEITRLKGEVTNLKRLLDKSKERDREERNQTTDRYSTRSVEQSVNLRRLAEVEEENAALLSETRKQQAIISKLRDDIKHVKMDYEAEIDKLDGEVAEYSSVVRQLKQDLKDKELKYDNDVDSLRKTLKQNTDNVKELQSQLHKAREQINVDRNGFEDVISQHAAKKYQDLKSLQESVKSYKSKYLRDVNELNEGIKEKDKMVEIMQNELNVKEMEINKLKEENEMKERDFANNVNQYKCDIESSQERFESTCHELNFALQEAIKSHERAVDGFTEKLNQKDKQIQQEQTTTEQLRTYIGEHLPNIQLERLTSENKQMEVKLEALIKENGNANSTLQFMKIRLTSLNEILSLQENELNKSLCARQDGADNVLTMWRHKVFSLLVQLKTQDITKDNHNKDTIHKVSALQEELETLQHDADMLSHTLADRHAELQIEVNTTKSLQEQLSAKESIEEDLLSTLNDYQVAIATLHGSALNMDPFMKELCSKMNDAFARLGCLSQRVSFATGRVEFLQGLFAHREAQWKCGTHMVLKDNETPVSESDGMYCGSCEGLLKEIQRLTQERDMLAAQVLKNAELLECRMANITGEYDDRIKESAFKMEQLELEVQDERERSSALIDKLQGLETDLQESQLTVEKLKSDLARHSYDTEKKLDDALAAKHAVFTEEMYNLEKQLNSVRDEHTKTVITLRQAEHQVTREREKAQEQLVLQQREFDMKLDQHQKLTRNLEKERNMLLTTVRQEGLKIPKQTISQHLTTDDSDTEKENNHDLLPTVKRNRHKKGEQLPVKNSVEKSSRLQPQPEEEQSMASALQDLKFLSEALLNMRDDDFK